MNPLDVKKLSAMDKAGLLHAAIMDQKNQDADAELETTRVNLKSWLKGQQHARSRH